MEVTKTRGFAVGQVCLDASNGESRHIAGLPEEICGM